MADYFKVYKGHLMEVYPSYSYLGDIPSRMDRQDGWYYVHEGQTESNGPYLTKKLAMEAAGDTIIMASPFRCQACGFEHSPSQGQLLDERVLAHNEAVEAIANWLESANTPRLGISVLQQAELGKLIQSTFVDCAGE